MRDPVQHKNFTAHTLSATYKFYGSATKQQTFDIVYGFVVLQIRKFIFRENALRVCLCFIYFDAKEMYYTDRTDVCIEI